MREAEVVQTGRTPTEVRLRLGVMCGALAVVAYALTQAVTLPLLPTLLLVCSFGPPPPWTSAWSPTSRPESRSRSCC